MDGLLNYLMFGEVVELDTVTIESKISQLDIFRYYCKPFTELDVNFLSELRKDNNPSARIRYSNNSYWYKDFGEVGRPINCYEYIMRKYGVTFNECLHLINNDFDLKIVPPTAEPSLGYVGVKVSQETLSQLQVNRKKDIKILKQTKGFSRSELNWWKQFGWTQQLLNFYDVISCQLVVIHINGDEIVFKYNPSDPIYIFDYNKNIKQRKMYRPLSSNWKWFATSHISNIVQGYKQLDKSGNICIITSSLKDVGTLRNIGYNAVAPSSENTLLKKEQINDLQKRFKKLVCYLDNDDSGLKAAESYKEIFDIPFIHNDGKDKDPSDLYSTLCNKQKFKKYVIRKLAQV